MQSPVLGRLAAALLFAALLFFAFPGASPDREARLAALDAGSLVQAELPDSEGQRLSERVLALARPTEEGLELELGSVRFADSPADLDGATRRSLVTGLRAAADGVSLAVLGEQEAVPGATSFTLRRTDDGLALSAMLPGATQALAVDEPWNPPNRTSLIPPILAISLAIALRRPLLSLLCGVLAGAVLAQVRGGAAGG